MKDNLSEIDFVTAIHNLLWQQDSFISNDMVFEELYRSHHEIIDPDDKKSRKWGNEVFFMRADFSQVIKKAKTRITKCLNEHGLDFEETKDPKDKRKTLYRYPAALDFNPLDELTKESKKFKLSQLLSLINESEGLFPQAWLSNFRLELNKETFPEDQGTLISFDTNNALRNIDLVPILYDCIKKKVVVSFFYHPFGKDGFWVTMHPKFLKEYNSRWFVFGATKKTPNSQYAIDRIDGQIKKRADIPYHDNHIDYKSVFRNVVGVSRIQDKPRKVELTVLDDNVTGYLTTKPLMDTQIINGNTIVFPAVVLNYEFVTRLLEFADRVKVICPMELNELLHKKLEKMNENIVFTKK